jgi:hypothetical protein
MTSRLRMKTLDGGLAAAAQRMESDTKSMSKL